MFYDYSKNKLDSQFSDYIDPFMIDIETAIELRARDNSLPYNWMAVYQTCLYVKTIINAEVAKYLENIFNGLKFKIVDVNEIEGGYLLSMDYDNA